MAWWWVLSFFDSCSFWTVTFHHWHYIQFSHFSIEYCWKVVLDSWHKGCGIHLTQMRSSECFLWLASRLWLPICALTLLVRLQEMVSWVKTCYKCCTSKGSLLATREQTLNACVTRSVQYVNNAHEEQALCFHTHKHNHFTAFLDLVLDYPGEPAPER